MRRDRIKELETELRILDNIAYVRVNGSSGFHARNNKTILRYYEIVRELEKISIKWRIKKILRRFKECAPFRNRGGR